MMRLKMSAVSIISKVLAVLMFLAVAACSGALLVMTVLASSSENAAARAVVMVMFSLATVVSLVFAIGVPLRAWAISRVSRSHRVSTSGVVYGPFGLLRHTLRAKKRGRTGVITLPKREATRISEEGH